MSRSRFITRVSSRVLGIACVVAACVVAPAVASAQGPRSTGLGAIGTVDPNYQVSVNGAAFTSAFVLDRGGTPGTFQWIGASASGSLPGGNGDSFLTRFTYAFRTTFTGGTATGFSYQCALDDVFTSIVLNGTTLAAGCDQYNFGATRTITGLLPGLNTLTINMAGNGTTDGLAVNITAVQTSTVPEPATTALLAAGLLAIGTAARRRRTRA